MNWKNSDFQIFYHVLGNCHTPVEGLRVLYELRQDRLFAIKSSLAESKRSESKVIASTAILSDKNESNAQRLISVCNIEEQNARMEIAQPCFEAAQHELAFILYLIGTLEEITRGPVTAFTFQKIQPVENAYDLVVRCHTDISLRSHPSAELLNEVRNSPYRKEIISAMSVLLNMFDSKADSIGLSRIEFLALPKSAILSQSGIVDSVGIAQLDLEKIEFPDLEKLECPKFPALASPSTNPNS